YMFTFKSRFKQVRKTARQEKNQLIENEIRKEFQQLSRGICIRIGEAHREEVSQLNRDGSEAFYEIVAAIERACEQMEEICSKLKETILSTFSENKHQFRQYTDKHRF
ncbi:MAG TPA: hypothetical protein VGU44_02390, partial [Gammaproteobacteria bacterium]|nr:hypothetical protein [Gammaproteobacteria bacterium]